MIRAVLDTNILISGSLWSGSPRLVLDTVYRRQVLPLVTEPMLDEMRDVITRAKFVGRLQQINQSAELVISRLTAYMEIVEASPIAPTIDMDPDDDEILACALSGNASYIVTGDAHLLTLASFRDIPIFTANQFLDRL